MFHCMQALSFQRYDCQGFTYWVKGLAPPVDIEDTATGRLSMLQSVAQDFGSLLFGSESALARGPFDLLAGLPSPHLQV